MAMLDEFMAQSGEITVIRNMVNKLVLKISKELPASKSVQHLEELLEEMHKINTIMQTKLTEIRKVPLSNVYRPVPRTVRDLCKSIGKEVKLEVEGDELRVDTLISQVLNNCVIHMVRNSIDHGIESPDVRTSRGKKREGTLKISSQESGENIIVHISDDGGGIDAERIKKKIIEREMLSAAEAQALSNEETYQYLFEAGLSTAEKITDVSGRGVGMDMVKTSIESLGGRIDVKSELGVGTTFSLNMPIPKSVQIINALIVTVDGFELSIPQDKVSRLIILEKEKFDGMIWATEGGEMLGIDGELLCIVDARSVLGLRANPHLDARHFVLAKTEDNHSYAIEVDGILDNESIVVKDMETCISDLGLFFGATFLASGQVGLILDVEGFAKHAGLDFKKASEKKPLKLESSQLAKETIDYISVTLHCNGKFAIPLNSVFRFERIAKSEIQVSGERKVVTYRDSIMPIVNLTQVLDLNRNEEEWSDENMSTIVIQSESQLFGFVIKSIEDVHHVSDDIHSLLKNRVGLLGNLIIAGRTHAVIDVNAIIEKFKISSRVAAKRA
jgi:two-component system, chemotaxis family, sensor kinase CheA